MKLIKKIFLSIMCLFTLSIYVNAKEVNLSDLSKIKTYEMKDYDNFLKDYKNNKLDGIYITKFLFDGVSMYKPFDLEDFQEKGNDYIVEPLEITVININTVDDITFTGELKGGMIAVNTNGKKGNINIILDNAKIDTDTKKAPVMYIYNKDILYTDAIVTIKTTEGSKNYLEGGKLKKISLMPKESISNSKRYNTYSNYYGIYSESEINNILFAKVAATREDQQEGYPMFYYKANGAISSDIDINFEGLGYLEIVGKNKEGIEGKGNISFLGGTGDYVILANEDCINTSSANEGKKQVHNTVTVDVNSLYAIVNEGADGGDGIDSNGSIYMNGGLFVGIPHTRYDAGLDVEGELQINGGTIFALGDNTNNIKTIQKTMLYEFKYNIKDKTNLSLLDSNDNIIFSYTTDRDYTFTTSKILFSTEFKDTKYYLYQNGKVTGDNKYNYYTNVTDYKKGKKLKYATFNKEETTTNEEYTVERNINRYNRVDDYSHIKVIVRKVVHTAKRKTTKIIIPIILLVVIGVVVYLKKRKKLNNNN